MYAEQKAPGLIIYHKEESDYLAEDVERAARLYAQSFRDTAAAQVPNLFPKWQAGVSYAAGARITDGKGNLYRVVQGHTSQADWPLNSTPAMYTPLGVTAANPDAVPDWVQPTGAHDAYQKGDQVRYEGTVYESLLDGNVYSPTAYPGGWAQVQDIQTEEAALDETVCGEESQESQKGQEGEEAGS